MIDMTNSIRRVAAMLLLYLGDLNRMKAKFEQQCGEDGIQSSSQALEFYNRAKTICPHEGKVFHQLGASC